jgi:hypothetical protein
MECNKDVCMYVREASEISTLRKMMSVSFPVLLHRSKYHVRCKHFAQSERLLLHGAVCVATNETSVTTVYEL